MHESFNQLLDSFRNIICSISWIKVSTTQAKEFYSKYEYIIELPCSASDKVIKVDKSILNLIEKEGFNNSTPLYSASMIDFYRVFTVALKDIIWEEPDFDNYKNHEHLLFLRHLRNASSHNNEFYWGSGRQRTHTISKFPIQWRSKIISEDLEGKKLYMEYFSPGDLFLLLGDISKLVKA